MARAASASRTTATPSLETVGSAISTPTDQRPSQMPVWLA
jgi:hypothetical protein